MNLLIVIEGLRVPFLYKSARLVPDVETSRVRSRGLLRCYQHDVSQTVRVELANRVKVLS
jgi:hypothetical protein